MTYAFLKYFHIIDAIPTRRKLNLNRTPRDRRNVEIAASGDDPGDGRPQA
jgi:hypothetical protein